MSTDRAELTSVCTCDFCLGSRFRQGQCWRTSRQHLRRVSQGRAKQRGQLLQPRQDTIFVENVLAVLSWNLSDELFQGENLFLGLTDVHV